MRRRLFGPERYLNLGQSGLGLRFNMGLRYLGLSFGLRLGSFGLKLEVSSFQVYSNEDFEFLLHSKFILAHHLAFIVGRSNEGVHSLPP